MALKFGVNIPLHGGYDYRKTLDFAKSAEEFGYDSIWVGDHFFLSRDWYVKIRGDPDKPDKLDPWITLAAMAPVTKRITLGTMVSPIPFYQPARLAKIVATLDILSQGRAILGAGLGWLKEEFLSYGMGWDDFSVRREKMLEGLEVILNLWTKDKGNFAGKFFQLKDAPFFPKPLQKPHPPIWVGGISNTAIETVARFGSGWIPEDPTIEQYKSSLGKLNIKIIQENRSAEEITPGIVLKGEATKEGRESLREKISAVRDIGAKHIVVYFESPTSEFEGSMGQFMEQVASEYK